MNIENGFNDLVYYDGYYYVASNTGNGLYRFNQDKCILISRFDDELDISDLFMQTVLYNGIIIFTPSNAKNLFLYDIKSDKMIKVSLEKRYMGGGKFHGAIIKDHYAFLMGHMYPAIVKLDLDSYNVTYIDSMINDICCCTKDKYPRFTYAYVINDIMYIPCTYYNYILELNIETEEYSIRALQGLCDKIFGYYIENNTEYIVSEKKIFVLKDKKEIIFEEDISLFDTFYLFSALKINDMICFFAFKNHTSADVFAIKYEQGYSIVPFMEEYTKGELYHFNCPECINNIIYLYIDEYSRFIQYDVDTNQFRESYSEKSLSETAQESRMLTLSDWLQII